MDNKLIGAALIVLAVLSSYAAWLPDPDLSNLMASAVAILGIFLLRQKSGIEEQTARVVPILDELEPNEKKVINLISSKAALSKKELLKESGLKKTDFKKSITSLVERGLIESTPRTTLITLKD